MSKLQGLTNKPILVFSFILLLKSAVAWYIVFDDGPNWSMVLTEVPIYIIVFSLIEWFAGKRKVLYYMIANLSITLIYFAVLMYYKYYGVIATYHALRQVKKVANVGESTYSLIAPYYLFVFVDIVFFLLLVIRPKYIKGWMSNTSIRMNRKILITVTAISLGLCTFNIWPNHASMNEHKKAESMGILGYELYTVIADTTEKERLIDIDEITQQAVNKLKGVEIPDSPNYWGLNKGNNLIVIQMESFQNFLLGLTINGQEVTPNLNKLVKENSYFSNFYTNAGQGTTSDAEFVVNTSFYVPENKPATSSDYMNKKVPW